MSELPGYHDRRAAGKVLASAVRDRLGAADILVFALPRGGVPVGDEVARAFDAPLDVLVVRKLGVPAQPEFAMGAIAPGGLRLLNDTLVRELGLPEREVNAVIARETAELHRREALYRMDRPALDPRNRSAVLVDDGLATGFTMRIAIAALRRRGAARVTVAVPVGAPDTCAELAREVDALICPLQPDRFEAVGAWYENFSATTDDEVRECLAQAAARHPVVHHGPA